MADLDRIQKLIALAASANEHEARSAAYLACKMIREGGYRVVASETVDPWAAFEAWARPEPVRSARPRPGPDLRPRRQVPSAVGRARRSGSCAVCGEPFDDGSDVATPTLAEDTHRGTAHADCRARWTVPVDGG